MVWRPFIRQMREIGETSSILETRIRQWMAETAERICAKFTRKTCFVLRSDEFEYQGQSSRSPGIKNALCTHNTPAVWTEWNGLVSDNVAQAADVATRSLQRGVFTGMRALGLAGIAGLCHAFLVYLCTVLIVLLIPRSFKQTSSEQW